MKSAITHRRKQAKESFQNAAECIGEITPGISLFAITRGQWSMIDAILHCLDQIGTSKLTLWTWTVAEYEVEVLTRLMIDKRVLSGELIIDHGARNKNSGIISSWKDIFGDNSVKYVVNHAKIATLQNDKYKLLLRGSMNLNFNARFENFDLTEGGEDFELVKQIESEIPVLSDNCTGHEVYTASRVSDLFSVEQLSIFSGCKVWAK